ncbi:hypothetical protein D9M68_916700 [compost metagenome]
MRQRIRQRDAAHPQRQARAHEAGRGRQIERAFHDGVKQQHREQEEIDQAFHLFPHLAVECREAADQVAAEDEREVGEEELGEVHRGSIAGGLRRPGSRQAVSSVTPPSEAIQCDSGWHWPLWHQL